MNYKAKGIIGKITNLFCIYFFATVLPRFCHATEIFCPLMSYRSQDLNQALLYLTAFWINSQNIVNQITLH
jgi:hypothetical protein